MQLTGGPITLFEHIQGSFSIESGHCRRLASAPLLHCIRMQVFKAALRLSSLLALLMLLTSACLVRRRTVVPAGKSVNQPLLKATKEELIARVHALADPLHSFQMKVDLSPSVGSLYGGQVTDYPTIAGIILFRRAADIRVIGLDPVVHSTAFDMLSMGNDFRVSIPAKNQFIEGLDNLPANSPNKLENLRPSAFRTSLLIAAPDPNTDITILADDTDQSKAIYILLCVHKEGDNYTLARTLYFDRHTLAIIRQKTFDSNGNITSQTHYDAWQNFAGVPFPTSIDIERPQDGYELNLKVNDLKMNDPAVTSEKFVLPQPPNSVLKVLK